MFKYIYVVLLFASSSLHALTTLHVSLSSDDNAGGVGDVGDLRYCLNTMNDQLNNSAADDYAIVFDFPMTIQLNGILPIINNSTHPVTITIGNAGSIPTVTIDGQNTYPGFFIPMGNVTIQNMIFQNFTAQGGEGGDGISGGGGGMGAGGAIYAPQSFLNGSDPTITLINVSINNCSAVGGNGGSYMGGASTGNEGGGGGGGFGGNGGSVTTTGSTGGAGGGGFGGNGGNVTIPFGDPAGGGGGGGGGLGSRATAGTPTNLGHGGDDDNPGSDGNGYGLILTAGSGGGGLSGGIRAGGAGGGAGLAQSGGGGGGSNGYTGQQPEGSTPPGGGTPSGGWGGDGGGGGGGGVVVNGTTVNIDGRAGNGGSAGGGGGGAGLGFYDSGYSVQGGSGGVGGGGGGGGVDSSGTTFATGGNSASGGGGGGGGPTDGGVADGGSDTGNLGGGSGGAGANSVGAGSGGGGGGGGSGLGGAIFVDTGLEFTIQAFSGIPTVFNTVNTTVQKGIGGTGASGAEDGFDGSELGYSIFLRSNSRLNFRADGVNDILTLGSGVAFVDDTSFGGVGTNVFVRGNGTVIYNGTTDYTGTVLINNANFKVNGEINTAEIRVCRDLASGTQRGTLSGSGTLTGAVTVNSGTISPDTGETLTLGSLTLFAASPGALGALVHSTIDVSGASLVDVTGAASLAGVLELAIDSDTPAGTYTLLTSSSITGTFDSVTFTGATPNYTLSYLPLGSPTRVELNFAGFIEPPSNLQGQQKKNNFGLAYELYNQLLWTLSPSSQTAAYLLYRDGQEIATLPATASLYQDHNRPFGVSFLYALIARDANGNMSTSATVTVP